MKDWAERRADLAPDRIAVYGVSKGANSRCLRLPVFRGSEPPSASCQAMWCGKAGAAQPRRDDILLLVAGRTARFRALSGHERGDRCSLRGENRSLTVPHLEGRRANPDRAALARIPTERFAGAMLIAGGDRDSTWPSGEMVRAIAERRAEIGRATTALGFTDAGHGLAGTGWNPLNYVRADPTVAANAAAQQKIWPATVTFLAEHLGREGDPPE